MQHNILEFQIVGVPNSVLMHYSMTFCSINSTRSVFTLKITKRKSALLNTRLWNVWDVGHFMHSTVAAFITSHRGRGYQTQIKNNLIKFIHYMIEYIVYSASFGTQLVFDVNMLLS